MGFDKILAPLAGGTVLSHSLAAFEACGPVGPVVVVCPAGREEEFRAAVAAFPKVVGVVPGGAERPHSVAAGARALQSAGLQWVAVHDAARPLIGPEAISACFQEALSTGAAALAEPLADTLHRADPHGLATGSIPRDNLWRAQTPQILPLAELLDADPTIPRTDEVSIRLANGKPVALIDPACPNFKITRPLDLDLAEAILARAAK